MDVTGTLLGGKPTVAEMIRMASALSQLERDKLRAALTRPAA